MKFRKKPVVIEAIQVSKRMDITSPQWLADAITSNVIITHGLGKFTREMPWVEIHTLEGAMRGDDGDWIIRGVAGELYPCKPDVFASTYEPVEAQLDDPTVTTREPLYPLVMPAPLRLPEPMTDEAIYDNDAIMAANSLAGLLFGDFATVVRVIETEVLRRVRECNDTPPLPVQQDGYVAGIEAVAAMIEAKAQAFADQHGSDDMGSLSFGSGNHAEVKSDYYNSLVELAEEARAMIDAAPTPPVQQDDDEIAHLQDAVVKMGDFLRQIVNLIRGEPPDGTSHSTHDAVELVRGLLMHVNLYEIAVAHETNRLRAELAESEQDDEALEVLKLALEAMTCGDTGNDLEDSHRCGKCDEYVDRNGPVRQRIRALLEKRGAA